MPMSMIVSFRRNDLVTDQTYSNFQGYAHLGGCGILEWRCFSRYGDGVCTLCRYLVCGLGGWLGSHLFVLVRRYLPR